MNLPKLYTKIIASLLFFYSFLCKKWQAVVKLMRKEGILYKISFVLSAIIIWAVIFLLNVKTHMTGDDYVYSFVYQTTDRLSSLKDVFESQYLHYFAWGGRSVVHVIGQALLLTNNPVIIDIINSSAFLLYIYLIYWHITRGRETSIRLFIMIFCFAWILQPVFAETILWITGSANYLWGTLIILLFLLPYRLFADKKESALKAFAYLLLMFAGGVIAGWTNENTAAGMIAMIVFFILYYSYKRWRIPLWAYSGLLGAITGYLFMIMAPGNFVRAEGVSVDLLFISFRLFTHTNTFLQYLGAFNLGIIILLILHLKFSEKEKGGVIPYIVIYVVGVLVSIYVMAFSPGFPARAWFGVITFNIIAGGVLLYNLDYSLAFMRQVKNSIAVFGVLVFCFSFYDAYKDVNTIDHIWKERIAVIEAKKKENAPVVVFKEYQASTKFGLGDTPYALKYISDYYGIEFQLER